MTCHAQINFQNVGHSFASQANEIQLFEDLNHQFRTGEVTSIIGPSGAGKSSLLALAAGLETPKVGQVQFALRGQGVTAEVFRAHTGFIFQQFHLLQEMDALHNLSLPLKLQGRRDAEAEARRWLDLVGLADRERHRPAQLSGGEQQRIAIARAFIKQPDFIFADEPTGNLDHKTAQAVMALMLRCARESGCGLVIVTHATAMAAAADRQLRLEAGRLEVLS